MNQGRSKLTNLLILRYRSPRSPHEPFYPNTRLKYTVLCQNPDRQNLNLLQTPAPGFDGQGFEGRVTEVYATFSR